MQKSSHLGLFEFKCPSIDELRKKVIAREFGEIVAQAERDPRFLAKMEAEPYNAFWHEVMAEGLLTTDPNTGELTYVQAFDDAVQMAPHDVNPRLADELMYHIDQQFGPGAAPLVDKQFPFSMLAGYYHYVKNLPMQQFLRHIQNSSACTRLAIAALEKRGDPQTKHAAALQQLAEAKRNLTAACQYQKNTVIEQALKLFNTIDFTKINLVSLMPYLNQHLAYLDALYGQHFPAHEKALRQGENFGDLYCTDALLMFDITQLDHLTNTMTAINKPIEAYFTEKTPTLLKRAKESAMLHWAPGYLSYARTLFTLARFYKKCLDLSKVADTAQQASYCDQHEHHAKALLTALHISEYIAPESKDITACATHRNSFLLGVFPLTLFKTQTSFGLESFDALQSYYRKRISIRTKESPTISERPPKTLERSSARRAG